MSYSTIFIPHGGGPLPILGHAPHASLTHFLKNSSQELITPNLIVVITAHWEAEHIQVSSAQSPGMLFDYYGFPPEAYELTYPAPGSPQHALEIVDGLMQKGVQASADAVRGFDHGTFVPLMLMYPEANIPVIQISLNASLNPTAHIQLGEALGELLDEQTLVIGSGLSFHNLSTMGREQQQASTESDVFDEWLQKTLALPHSEAQPKLAEWESAPYARFCHPREEHLLPLLVCFGVAKARHQRLKNIYSQPLMGNRVSAFAA